MITATPRHTIDRLNQEQRSLWDTLKTADNRERCKIRLHEIAVELQDAWDAERIARAAIKNPQVNGVLPLLSRRHR